MSDAGLTEHLRDAIRLNRARRAGYRRRGGLRADLLSRALVAAERALLPAAWLLDREARRHPVPILRAELVPMSEAPPAGTFRPGAAAPEAASVRVSMSTLVHIAWSDSLETAGVALAARIDHERARSTATGRLRPLTVHLLESARLSAARGARYARQTGGGTRGLSRRIVLGHLALVPFARLLDRLAAPVHARGVGLFVDDVPPIPEP